MECEPGHVINLIRANYGRFSITICNDHGNTEWSVNCMSRRSHRVLHDKWVVTLCWGSGYPMLGQWLPYVGVVVILCLGSGYPMLGQWLPYVGAVVTLCWGSGTDSTSPVHSFIDEPFVVRKINVLFLLRNPNLYQTKLPNSLNWLSRTNFKKHCVNVFLSNVLIRLFKFHESYL